MPITSAAGVISLLEEDQPELQSFALRRLNEIVDLFWAEISENVGKIELLHEDPNFQHAKLAALVASKVYYHLGSFDDSLIYALNAEELFNVHDSSEFTETIIAKCIDRYTKIKVAEYDSCGGDVVSLQAAPTRGGMEAETFRKLEQVVDRMFDRCFDHKQYRQALGISLETRRLDMFEKSIHLSDDKNEMLQYAFRISLILVNHRAFRNRVLSALVHMYMSLPAPDYVNLCQCLIFLDDPKAVAEVLERLIGSSSSEDDNLMAFQIGFDLYENATQQFLGQVAKNLRACRSIRKVVGEPETPAPVVEKVEGEEAMETSQPPAAPVLTEAEKQLQKRYNHLTTILSGEKVIELHLQFLIRNNKTDLKLLDRIKEDIRNSILHNATVMGNSIMHFGTTSDQFLRDNLEWLGRATNWAKFIATASLGVIHRGHEKEALKLMAAYLPKDSASGGSAYSEGGGLYALGLIHANHGGDSMTDYLLQQTREATSEAVRHGACLGLGLAAMGTGREDVYDQIKLNLYQDDAVTGEAAGLALGLVMLGTGSTRTIEDLLSYAKETAHEKIQRGLALGVALTMYGRMEEADHLIDGLLQDKDPILRWSGMATVAMAYCGSGRNCAVRRLLHAAVSDTNDDVRRWAVISLGFLLFKNPEQVPPLVSLLSESYNPHVRYGAAMAVGLACAGTALKDAIAILEPMIEDSVHFVRQGALIAMGMLLAQQNGVTCPRSAEFRQQCLKIITDKHDDVMAKFGAILAISVLDAGGRNCTISLQTRTGHSNMCAAVGLLVFQNFWYWYPLVHFFSLSFTPTAIIALNKDLQMPKMEFISNAKPSTFAYPPPYTVNTEKKKEKVETAVLSTTAKQKKKAAEKKAERDKSSKESDKNKTISSSNDKDKVCKDEKEKEEKLKEEKEQKAKEEKAKEEKAKEEKAKEEKAKEEKVKEEKAKVKESCSSSKGKESELSKDASKEAEKKDEEPNSVQLSNPARVMRAQLRVLSLPEGRYVALKPVAHGGILMVRDRRPNEEVELVECVKAHGPNTAGDDDDLPEPEPPEPFEYIED